MQTQNAAIQRVLKWPLWPIVGTILTIKALLFLFAALSFQVITNIPVGSLREFFSIWNRWDAIHYVSVATHGYASAGERLREMMYFPLFPWLTRLVALALRDVVISSIFVSTVASFIAGILLFKLIRLDETEERAKQAVLFLFIFPTSYFLHAGYTESLFLALVLGAFLAARQKEWLLAGLLGAFASMTRINGLILMPALAVEAFVQYREDRRWRWEWFFIGTIGLGFVVYAILNNHFAGDPFAFLSLQGKYQYRTLAWPWAGIYRCFDELITREPWEAIMLVWQELFFVLLTLVCTVLCFIKLRPSYGIWMVLNWLVFTSSSFVQSVPRYALILFPIFILSGRLVPGRWGHLLVTLWSLVLLSFFTALFVTGRWAF